MPLDTSHRLAQRVCPVMLIVGMLVSMLMKDKHGTHIRPLTVMDVPVISCVPGHYGHIIVIHGDDVEVYRIKAFQIIVVKHSPPQIRFPQPFCNCIASRPRTLRETLSFPSGTALAVSLSLLP